MSQSRRAWFGFFLGISFLGVTLLCSGGSLQVKTTCQALLAAQEFLGFDLPPGTAKKRKKPTTREFLGSIEKRFFPPSSLFTRLQESAGERFGQKPGTPVTGKQVAKVLGISEKAALIFFDRDSDQPLAGAKLLTLEVVLLLLAGDETATSTSRRKFLNADFPLEIGRAMGILRLFLDQNGDGEVTLLEAQPLPSDCRKELMKVLKKLEPATGENRPYLLPSTPKKKTYDPELLEKRQRWWNLPVETTLW